MARVLVLGAGSWGTALALQLAYANNQVYLWSWRDAHNHMMINQRTNAKYLPNHSFPNNLEAILDWQSVIDDCDFVLISVPSKGFKDTCQMLVPKLKNQGVISATKGFCHDTFKLLDQIFADQLPNRDFAILTGPSFAKEVANKLPTAVLIAANNHTYAQRVQTLFGNTHFRCYSSIDMIGAQIGGAVKNVLAIAAGISDGLGFGANARAGLITRGLKEMSRLGLTLGGKKETFAGLSGLGDLILTCTDNQSRNRRFGVLLGEGKTQKEAFEIVEQVVEGVATAEAVYQLAQKNQVEMPIVETVYQILYQQLEPKQAVQQLMLRTLKSETE